MCLGEIGFREPGNDLWCIDEVDLEKFLLESKKSYYHMYFI